MVNSVEVRPDSLEAGNSGGRSARHRSRVVAMQVLYEMDSVSHNTSEIFDRHIEEMTSMYDGQIIFSEQLMRIEV